MISVLRLAAVAVTLSLLGSLAWLTAGDQFDWSATALELVSKVDAFLTPAKTAYRDSASSGALPIVRPVGFDWVAQNQKPDSREPGLFDPTPIMPRRRQMGETSLKFDEDQSIRQTQLLDDKTQPHMGLTLRPVPDNPGDSSDIELAAGIETDELTAVSRAKDRFDLVVRNKDISYVIDLLNSTGKIKIVALPNVKGPVTLTSYNTTIEKALEAVLKTRGFSSRKEEDYILVYSQADLDELDAQAGKVEIYTYKPEYISALDLIQVLTPHLSEKGKISSTRPNQIGIAANADNAGGDQLAVPDAIVIQDIAAIIEKIKVVIKEVDVLPAQVLIEAVLLSVELNDDHHLGVNFAGLEDSPRYLAVSGNGSVLNSAAGFSPSTAITTTGKSQGASASNDHGFKFAVSTDNLTAFVNLLETVGHTTVLASPKVLALNKQRAEIIVGSQLGYRTVTTTETAAVESVQFLDVGTQLRMRPFVQPDGRIRMEIHPEKSSGKVSETTGLPEKDTTQVTTNLTVRSGETIVIGGLIEEQQQRSIQQIPFLGSLPGIGRLFRDETNTLARSELIILITPKIIDEDEEYTNAIKEVEQFSKRRNSLEQTMPVHIRLAQARKYVDRAYKCRAEGDMKTAREMVNLALDFDPTCEEALKLKSELSAHQHTDHFTAAPVGSRELLRLTPVASSERELRR